MTFEKKEISMKVMEFLETNLNEEEDKKSFARLLKGNKLLFALHYITIICHPIR